MYILLLFYNFIKFIIILVIIKYII